MKKLAKVIGVIVAVLVLGSVILMMIPTDDSQTTLDSEELVETADIKKPEDGKTYEVGEVINYKGLSLTITKAEFTKSDEYVTPDNGKVLTLYVEAVNNADTELWVDNTDFTIYDSEGNLYDQYYGYEENPIVAQFAPGKKASGKLYFDVPESGKYEVIYNPSYGVFDGSDNISINIEMTK